MDPLVAKPLELEARVEVRVFRPFQVLAEQVAPVHPLAPAEPEDQAPKAQLQAALSQLTSLRGHLMALVAAGDVARPLQELRVSFTSNIDLYECRICRPQVEATKFNSTLELSA